jgi:hypothetical protein
MTPAATAVARRTVRGLFALLLAVPLVATGGTAQAAACSGSSGVTVVVQFPDHTETGCAPGDPTSGANALKAAGFSVTPVVGKPFVCQINATPNSSCSNIPPADAYWAYFHAKRGGSWDYSSQGAWSSNPAPGSVEGWRFGDGARPTTQPPPAAATPKPKPKPSPTQHTSAKPAPTASASPGADARGTAAAKAAKTKVAKAQASKAAKVKAVAKKKAVAEARASTTLPASPATSQSAGAAGPVDQSAPGQQGGGNVPWLWGLVGLVVVGGAAGAVTLARRH